uniref:Ganglioside-induced differentiation-associated protein 1 n=1 Tax=Cacopsylla melanoneura TaxID=428564 RepID=A0A8D9EAL9_9HEMI
MIKSQHEESDLLLYFHHNSFYSQKVIMTLHEKGINFKTHLVNLASNEQYEAWFLEINPLGEVPVLVDGVKVIPDSKRIIQYLEDNFSNGYKRLLPQDDTKIDVIALRDDIDSLPIGFITKGAPYHTEYLLNSKSPFLPSNRAFMMDAQSRRCQIIQKAANDNPLVSDILLDKVFQQHKFHVELKSVQNYEQALERVDEVMNKMEAVLIENNKDKPKDFVYLFSKEFTSADISLTVLLVRLDQLGLSHRYWNATSLRPLIDKYYCQVKQRDSFKQSIPQYGSGVDRSLWYFVSGLSVLVLLSAVYFFRRRK